MNDSKEGYGDYMPDIFYFHFMGKSGKLFLGNDGNWKVASDDNLMVYKSYTSTGLPSEYTDENGMTVRLLWDNNDRLLSYTHGSLTTTCEYTDGLPASITQPNGVRTQYEYDSLRRLSEILDGNGNTRQRFGYGYRNR